MLAKQLCGRQGRGWLGAGRVGEWKEGSYTQLGSSPGIYCSLGSLPAPVHTHQNSQVLLLAESSSHEQPSLPRSPNYRHGETLCLVCVSCRVQLNFQGRTDNVEFYPLILENRKDQRNPPTHLSSRRGILLLQSISILLHVT